MESRDKVVVFLGGRVGGGGRGEIKGHSCILSITVSSTLPRDIADTGERKIKNKK